MKKIYEVIVDISGSEIDRVFDYSSEADIPEGCRVAVPFNGRVIEGFVVSSKPFSELREEKIKDIIEVREELPDITAEMLELADFMKSKYNLRTVDCLRLFIPSEMRKSKVKELSRRKARLTKDYESKLQSVKNNAKAQLALIDVLRKDSEFVSVINADYPGALRGLIQKGIAEVFDVVLTRVPYGGMDNEDQKHVNTPQQDECLASISRTVGTYLLFGVTGSGKTEVYIQAIEKQLEQGKTAIMLVPEISLTPNVLRFFRGRFGDRVAILHSGLSAGERYDEWNRLRRGTATVAIGARSAIFAPLENVGIIVIDEEHDSSYQSESNPRYNTIEIAEFRARYNKCSLVLGSATPSLESYYRAQCGEYTLLKMEQRINNRLPEVEIVDMAMEVGRGNKSIISKRLEEEMDDAIAKGNQIILFLNRRGYSSFMMCNACGYVAKCQDCDISLTYHREENVLKCHYCGRRYKVLDTCPNCGSSSIRQGKIGTQQIADILGKMYPNVKVIRMDYDTMQKKDSHALVQEQFKRGEAQILVGTQMVTKGHDFPKVTLVGVLDGDQSLFYGDYRSSERTFQLITQVAGRSGRDKLKGKVILQTYTPMHFAIKCGANQDFESFYRKEINIREASRFPPFCTFIRVLYSGEDAERCIGEINRHFDEILELRKSYGEDAFIFLQKMRSPVKRIESKYRFQILMRIENGRADEIIKKLYSIINQHRSDISVFVELNPQNLN
ncbi:MAG: primosomal protein N' [Clostridia bacterium]|nr:primosomal protein N' [Clostridia bacterium]